KVSWSNYRDFEKARATKEGWSIDRVKNEDVAWYTTKDLPEWGIIGNSNKAGHADRPAVLRDHPGWGAPYWVQWQFEAYATCMNGKDAGQVYGGISWGFNVWGTGRVESLRRKFLEKQSDAFTASIGLWDDQAAGHLGVKNSENQQKLRLTLRNPE